MSQLTRTASEAAAVPPVVVRRTVLTNYLELTKARLSLMVVFTTAVGYVLASTAAINWIGLLWTVIGTALAAGAANAFNEILETQRDQRMRRTRDRPLPARSMSVAHALVAAIIMANLGITILAAYVNFAAAGLALLSLLLYVLVYTPLKPYTTLNTAIGAVVGAIPPMIGWVAALGTLSAGAWVLGAILFAWQLPHFLSLAWLYREDYQRAGFRMLPVIDANGRLTCQVVLMTSLALVPITLAATMVGTAGLIYAAGSIVLGIWLSVLAVRLHRGRTAADARRMFLASLIYLPLVLSLMLVDRGPIGY
jgi:protoheme IX farnesyltransferase